MNCSTQAKTSNDSCKHLPDALINRAKPIAVPIFNLPEYLCVETKWVSRKFAMENKIQPNGAAERIANGGPTEVSHKHQERSKAIEIRTVPSEDYPRRERSVQTEEKNTCDVGVQCCRDDDYWDWAEPKHKETKKDPKDSASEEATFLIFVSENTSMFPNGMLECMVCGEVASTLTEHQGHMKWHYGPKVLCCHCGQWIAHEKLLKRHNLSCSGLAPRKSSMLFKCPHPLCSSMCHSEMQLLHHLEKHKSQPSYRCLQCKRNFKTTTALLLHRKSVKACSKAKCLTLFRKHKLPKGKCNLRRCSICLKRFSSERICNRHKRKCILGHQQGLSKALLKQL